MKTIKNLLALFVVGVALIGGVSHATLLQGSYSSALNNTQQWFFDQIQETTPLSQAQCTADWVTRDYYLGGDANNDGVKDYGKAMYLRDNFVVNGGTIPLYLVNVRSNGMHGTQVRYYTPESNMLSVLDGTNTLSLGSKNAWYRLSKVAPTNQWVRAVESEPMLYSIPQSGNPTNKTMQVAYNIFYRAFDSKGTNTSDYDTWPVSSRYDPAGLSKNSNRWTMNANWTIVPRWQEDYTKTANKITTSSINWAPGEIEHGYECFNVTVHWCGDGVVNNGTFDNGAASEQCDLGAENGKPGSECTATCTIVPKPLYPDLSIVKSVVGEKTGYLTGDTINYKLLIRNIGEGLATNAVVVDQLPAGVTYIAGSAKLGTTALEPTYDKTTNTLRWNVGNMPAGYYNEITFSVKLNEAPYCAPYKNDATIASNPTDGETNMDNNNSTDTFYTSCDNPDVYTKKQVTAVSGSYMPGQTVQYTLTYGNQGSGVANGVTLTDSLPTHVTYVANSASSNPNIGQPTVNGNTLTWNVGTLQPGARGTITILVKINATAPVCTNLRINNNFTVSATNEPDTLLENNPSSADFLMQCVDLWSLKSVDKPVVSSGDIVTYTLTYGNSGTVAWPGTVVDTLPAKIEYVSSSSTSNPNVGQPVVNGKKLTWNVGILQPGARGTITFKARVLGPLAASDVLVNNVCIEGETYYPDNNCDDVPVTPKPEKKYYDLSIDKNPKLREVELGDVFDYTLTVKNNGTAGVTNFTVKDYLPKGLEYVSSSNNGSYDLATKTITWKGLEIAAVGEFNLTVKVKYIGPKSNGKETNYTEICDYTGVSSTGEPKDIDSDPCNGTGNNEDDTSNGSIVPKDVKYYDLSIDKNPKTRQVELGDVFDYTLTVNNSGTAGVTNFTVKDYLPKGLEYVSSSNNGSYDAATKTITWKGLDIAAVGEFNLTVKVKYIGPKSNGVETNYTEICDYTGVSSTGEPKDIDSNPCNGTGNNEDDTSNGKIYPKEDLPSTFDLSINKLVNGKKSVQVQSGEIVDFSLVVKNEGPATATGFTVKDYLPEGLTYIQSSDSGVYTASDRTLTWKGLTLKAKETKTLTFKARYVDVVTRTNYTEICDYTGVSSTGQPKDVDSDPCNGTGNNEDDTSNASVNPITDFYDLSLNKTINDQKILPNIQKGTQVTIKLAVTNSGTVGVTGFSVQDYMPADLEFIDGSVTVNGSKTSASSAYTASDRTLRVTNLTLNARDSLTISFRATYNGTVERTNYAEICTYNGYTAYTGTDAKDVDSNPCDRGANPTVDDDESSAKITPYTSSGWSGGGGGGGGGSYCGDRVRDAGEVCDMGANGGIIPTGQPYAGRFCYGTNSPYACSIRAIEDVPTCSYIDPPSIQQGEYLPYRWDLESKKTGVDLDQEDFVPKCVSGSTAGKIVRDSVTCKFTVKNSKNEMVDDFYESCFANKNANTRLVSTAYDATLKSLGYTKDEFPTPAGKNARQFNYNRLGEHSIDVSIVSYKICNPDGTDTATTINNGRVCQMNFAVTKPYIVSRGALGDYATDNLMGFYQFPKGDSVFTSPVPALTANYGVTNEVKIAVNDLIAEYQKIAVKADSATFSTATSTVTVYKVPNKEIYIFSPNNENATITVGERSSNKSDKPFTLILTRGNLVVKGDMENTNSMYIAQNGNIEFSLNDCNTNQTVNGIFISLKNITSSAGNRVSAHNDSLSNEWCSEGAITVNGVLIGDGINDPTKPNPGASSGSILGTRRSNVNNWFRDMSMASQATEKQNALKNNAALVLRYNSDIFTNLPPGAEALSQVLNVYKR